MENKDKLNFAVEKMLEGWLQVLPAIKESVKDAAMEAVDELANDQDFIEAFADAMKQKSSEVVEVIDDKFLPGETFTTDNDDSSQSRKKRHSVIPLDDIVSPGDILTWKDNSDITCIVTQNPKFVVFEDEITTINKAALKILHRTGRNWATVNAREFWCLNGKTLVDIILESREREI